MTINPPGRPRRSSRSRVAVISANETPWGGSEELWHRAALDFAARGLCVDVYKPRLPRNAAPVRQMRAAGCRLVDLARPFGLPSRAFGLLSFASRPLAMLMMVLRLALGLLLRRPALVILSQGGNWDGLYFGLVLLRLKIPFVLVSQKASELYWPPDHLMEKTARLYRGSLHAYFVSEHNRRLTEAQLGSAIRSTSVVRNPFLVPFAPGQERFPEAARVEAACVGRLYPMEKGQDLLIQVLAQEKWRERPIFVTFYGEGIQRQSLERLGKHLGLANLHFGGHVDDPAAIWRRHPLLILPSRCEGLPLVVVEAMLAARVVVATDAGGTGEVIDDGVTGFLAQASSVAALDEVMERAWRERSSWPGIGAAAAESIRTLVPSDPGAVFAADVIQRCGAYLQDEHSLPLLGELNTVAGSRAC